MAQTRVKFTTRIDREILLEIRRLARSEGKQLTTLIDEALTDLIAKRRPADPRPYVMAAYRDSHEKLSSLYEKLAE